MEISTTVVSLLGVGATLKYAYKVFLKGNIKNVGALITTLYLTLVYIALSMESTTFHGGSFVRVGVVVLFIDKVLVFAYDLVAEIKRKSAAKGGEYEDGK